PAGRARRKLDLFFELFNFRIRRPTTLIKPLELCTFKRQRKGGSTMEVLKVSSKSNPNKVAGALAGVIREKGRAEIQAIGAGAVNQAIKAIAIARGYLAPSGFDLVCVPAFTDV